MDAVAAENAAVTSIYVVPAFATATTHSGDLQVSRFPWRIAFSVDQHTGEIGVPTPVPPPFVQQGLREPFLDACTSCIRRLAGQHRFWSRVDTFVAIEAFRLGALFGCSNVDRCKHCTSRQG
jgi:hypothetical protein